MLSLKLSKDARKRSKAEKRKRNPGIVDPNGKYVFESPYLQGTRAKRTRVGPTVALHSLLGSL